MGDEYTPTTEQVLGGYTFDRLEIGGVLVDKSTAEFDRWLEANDREVAEKAWDEGFAHGFNSNDYRMTNPYRKGVIE